MDVHGLIASPKLTRALWQIAFPVVVTLFNAACFTAIWRGQLASSFPGAPELSFGTFLAISSMFTILLSSFMPVRDNPQDLAIKTRLVFIGLRTAAIIGINLII